jgi:hypothetical protein
MKGDYLIIVIESENSSMVHNTIYESEPLESDIESLKLELKTNKLFGLTENNNLIFVSIKLPYFIELNKETKEITYNNKIITDFGDFTISLLKKLDKFKWTVWH